MPSMRVKMYILTSLRQLLTQDLKMAGYRDNELIVFVAFDGFDESISILHNRVGRNTTLVGQLTNQFAHRFVRNTGMLPRRCL